MTYLLDRDGDSITLDAPLTSATRAREVPGHRHDTKARLWRYPLSWATCVVARGVFGDELTVGPALADWAAEEYRNRIVPAVAAREGNATAGGPDLYPFQRAGVAFLDNAGSALMADEMGTGKTVQTVRALEERGSYPALVVCPNSVKSVWAREFAQWAPERSVQVAPSGTAAAAKAIEIVGNGGADVLVMNWEALKNLSRLAPYGSIRLESCSRCDPTSTRKPELCEREPKVLNLVRWSAVVADEAHRAKNPKASQTRALWAIGDRADRRIALTGTPIANSADDLWSLMRFVSPDEYPAKWQWVDRYALTTPNVFSGGVDVQGLRPDRRAELDKFFLPRFIRRTKAEVLPDLPPKVYERRDVFLSGKQRKAYESLSKSMIADVKNGKLVTTNALTASLRLRQLASAYGELIVGKEDAEDYDVAVRLTEPSTKLDVLEEVLEELGPRQAVIFADSRQLIDLAYARLGGDNERRITGTVPEAERAQAVDDFQGGGVQYLLCTVGAGGEGLTLTAADTAIFLQRPWSAVLSAQAEDRLHRVGQEASSVTYIDLVTVDTIEENVFEALRKKDARLQDVVRDAVPV